MIKIKNQSVTNNLSLKIFHGVEIKLEKLLVLPSIFGVEQVQLDTKTIQQLMFTKDSKGKPIINLEADIITIRTLTVRHEAKCGMCRNYVGT